MLVDFFIVGVQKGGTTALAQYLQDHPSIQMSERKEVHHFDDESRVDWTNPDHRRLHDQFDWAVENVQRGEATPIYIYWPWSLERLHRYNPKAKLIVGLRHPTFRAWSQWRMEITRGKETMSFEDAVSDLGRDRVRKAPLGAHRVYSYVERGLYAAQVDRLLNLFSREQVYFFRTDNLWSKTSAVLTEIELFLGVEPILGERTTNRYIVPFTSDRTLEMPAVVRTGLDSLYARDIELAAQLTGLNFADWLSPDYEEPMNPGS